MVRHIERSGERSGTASLDSAFCGMELLEVRRLRSSSTLPDYTTFAHTTGLQFNGYGSATIVNKHSIQLTDDKKAEARSFWYTSRVSINSFDTTFSFISSDSATSADGITFTIQPYGPKAIGTDGHDLGYAGIGRSVGVSFNLFNYMNFGSRFSFDGDGQQPASNVVMGNVNLHDGDLFTCTLDYNGTTLSARVVDDGHPSDVFTDSEVVNIVKATGEHSDYVGFTGATGTYFSTQEITNWTYSYGPQITSLTASPSNVTKHVSTLTATASDPLGTKGLVYSWNLVSAPAGARAVAFSNNESTANDTTVTVFTDGDYVFEASVRDKDGFRVSEMLDLTRS